MTDITGFLALIGPISIGTALWVLAHLSRRLGEVTHARPYYRLLYGAALLVWISIPLRLLYLLGGVALSDNLNQNILWIVLYIGLPALGLTLGLIVAWRYWSWMLAERD